MNFLKRLLTISSLSVLSLPMFLNDAKCAEDFSAQLIWSELGIRIDSNEIGRDKVFDSSLKSLDEFFDSSLESLDETFYSSLGSLQRRILKPIDLTPDPNSEPPTLMSSFAQVPTQKTTADTPEIETREMEIDPDLLSSSLSSSQRSNSNTSSFSSSTSSVGSDFESEDLTDSLGVAKTMAQNFQSLTPAQQQTCMTSIPEVSSMVVEERKQDEVMRKRNSKRKMSVSTSSSGTKGSGGRLELTEKPLEQENKSTTCTVCKHKFSTKAHLKAHLAATEKGTIECGRCAHTFENETSRVKHIKYIHLREVDYKFECSVCNRKFEEEARYKKHLMTHKSTRNQGLYKCNVCHFEFSSPANLKIHEKAANSGRNKCEFVMGKDAMGKEQICTHRFMDQRSLTKHLCQHRKKSKQPPSEDENGVK